MTGRTISPSLKIGTILSVEHYPSSVLLGKHGAEPKLGSNGRLAAIRRGRFVRTSPRFALAVRGHYHWGLAMTSNLMTAIYS